MRCLLENRQQIECAFAIIGSKMYIIKFFAISFPPNASLRTHTYATHIWPKSVPCVSIMRIFVVISLHCGDTKPRLSEKEKRKNFFFGSFVANQTNNKKYACRVVTNPNRKNMKPKRFLLHIYKPFTYICIGSSNHIYEYFGFIYFCVCFARSMAFLLLLCFFSFF